MTIRRTLAGAVIATVSWIIGYFATRAVTEGMSATSAYAVLVGWWFTAYVASRVAIPVLAAAPLSAAYFALYLFAAIGGQSWFYGDVSSLTLVQTLGIGLLQAAIIGSPILFDGLFRIGARIWFRAAKRKVE